MRAKQINGYYAKTNSEIAQELGITTEQVKSAIKSGLRKLMHRDKHMQDFRGRRHWEYLYNCKLQGSTPWQTTDLS